MGFQWPNLIKQFYIVSFKNNNLALAIMGMFIKLIWFPEKFYNELLK